MYNINNQKTERFTITMGVTAGYFHNNENESEDVYDIWSKYALEEFNNTGIYISAVINENKVVYNADWGCPKGGETVFTISAERNPQFVTDKEQYRQVVENIATKVGAELQQSTFTIVWSDVELNYCVKQ